MNRRSFVMRSLGVFAGLVGLSSLPKLKVLPVKSSVIVFPPGLPVKVIASGKVLKCDGLLQLASGSNIRNCSVFCDQILYGGLCDCRDIHVTNSEFFVSRVSHPHPLGGLPLTFWEESHMLAEGCEFCNNILNFDSGTVLAAKRKFLV